MAITLSATVNDTPVNIASVLVTDDGTVTALEQDQTYELQNLRGGETLLMFEGGTPAPVDSEHAVWREVPPGTAVHIEYNGTDALWAVAAGERGCRVSVNQAP